MTYVICVKSPILKVRLCVENFLQFLFIKNNNHISKINNKLLTMELPSFQVILNILLKIEDVFKRNLSKWGSKYPFCGNKWFKNILCMNCIYCYNTVYKYVFLIISLVMLIGERKLKRLGENELDNHWLNSHLPKKKKVCTTFLNQSVY